MDDMIYIGIDPGLSGCMVAINENAELIGFQNVQCEGESIDIDIIVDFLSRFSQSSQVIIENPHVHSGDGIKTVYAGFRYGYSVGTLQSIPQALGFHCELIAPMSWKSYFKLTGGQLSYQERKEKSVELACNLLGCQDTFKLIKQQGKTQRVIYLHDKAEAYLLAYYLLKHSKTNH